MCLQTINQVFGKDATAIDELTHHWFPLKNEDECKKRNAQVKISLTKPVIGIGAPAKNWLPGAYAHLDADCIIPDKYMVGTAVGAAVGTIGVSLVAEIRPTGFDKYVLHLPSGVSEFDDLENAIHMAKQSIERLAVSRMEENGITDPLIEITVDERKVKVRKGALHLSTIVKANATGKIEKEIQRVSRQHLEDI
jgi:hypothetical protein